MKVLSILICCAIAVLEPTTAGVPTNPHHKNGTLTPKLTFVATVDGKAFFVDSSIPRVRDEAVSYCELLGMRLAVIRSLKEFLALDQAVVKEWPLYGGTWTGGKEATGNDRYVWESSKSIMACSDVPYRHRLGEDFTIFFKSTNSYLSNALSNEKCISTLCETLPSDKYYAVVVETKI